MSPAPLWTVILTVRGDYGEHVQPHEVGVFSSHKGALVAGMAAVMSMNVLNYGFLAQSEPMKAYRALAERVDKAEGDPEASKLYEEEHDDAINALLDEAEVESCSSGLYPTVTMHIPEESGSKRLRETVAEIFD